MAEIPSEEEVIRFGEVTKREFKEKLGCNLDDVEIIYQPDCGIGGTSYVDEGISYIHGRTYQKTITHELEHHAFFRALTEKYGEDEAIRIMCLNPELREGLSEVVALEEMLGIYDETTLIVVEEQKKRLLNSHHLEYNYPYEKYAYSPLTYARGYATCSSLRKAFSDFAEMQRFLINDVPDLVHISDTASLLERLWPQNGPPPTK